jgi:hypothetical protein
MTNLIQHVSVSIIEQEKTKRWILDAKREHMTVTAQYRAQYENLNIKHFDLESIRKNYLGRVKFFPQNSHEGYL